MPLLTREPGARETAYQHGVGSAAGHEKESVRQRPFVPDLFRTCAYSQCRSGWLHLFRKRGTPVFEDGWTCSPECTEGQIQSSLRRELAGRTPGEDAHRHRIPLGLLMLEQGWITGRQLREALEAQKIAGTGRIGSWLMRLHGIDETTVTRALGIQGSCPVLSVEPAAPFSMAGAMPRLFLDACGALPLRVVAGKLLYLGFEDRVDPVLALAVERMTGLRVECGVVQSSVFRAAQTQLLNETFPQVQLGEAVSVCAAGHMLARAVERRQPVASRLVGVHDCVWLRMFLARGHEPIPRSESIFDVVFSLAGI